MFIHYQISGVRTLVSQLGTVELHVPSCDDGTNFIGYVAHAILACHGIEKETVEYWGGSIVTSHRPEQSIAEVLSGNADVLLQEAIMTPWWEQVVEELQFVPLQAEPSALARFAQEYPGAADQRPTPLPAGFWKSLSEPLSSLDFSDFVILVRDDMSHDVAHLLTWCLVETRDSIEGQYCHLRPERSPLTCSLDPKKMVQTSVPLHHGARRYYQDAGHLQE